MTESESVISAVDSHDTGLTGSTGLTGGTTITTTNLPVAFVSAYKDEQQRHQQHTLPKLPSHRFRYSVWHDLSKSEIIKGSELKAPRIRAGPPEKEEFFYKVRDENERRIHHTKRGKERKDYRNRTENWENTIHANLSYQELGHKYQMDNFLRVLKRLIRAEEVNLFYNGLRDLKSISFPRCKHLVMGQNYINSFQKLPRIPAIEELDLSENYIQDLDGLTNLCRSPIKSLTLTLNPVTFTLNYRQRVFEVLPGLLVLDGVAKLPEDSEWCKDQQKPTTCVIT